ncbi:MAG: DUF1697 domain-containing protein [Candidatus Rokubacteria bacterium]|nr:DUF1697 domain-containing protein [Candidatus Rokubacteria bacterium]
MAFIRGINVGGKHLIPMEVLRGLCAKVGLADARTYIQSGNVVFRAGKREMSRAEAALAGAVEAERGFRPSVAVRTLADLRRVASARPFGGRRDLEPGKLLVMFLTGEAGPGAAEAIGALKTNPERIELSGREAFLYFPNGIGKSKLALATVERALKASGTTRNWNTVTTMLAMAEELGA